MKAVCEKHGALLILDEVMCGMGRTGTLHAWQQEGVAPDIQAVGKGLGAGYAPIAGMLINHKVVNALDRGSRNFNHGHTYQAHALACAAAFEVQSIIQDDCLLENATAMGTLLGASLKDALLHHAHVGDIRGRGLFWAIEFVQDKETKAPFPASEKIAMQIQKRGMQDPYNIALYPGSGTADGTDGDHIMLAPAYTVTEGDVKHMVDIVARVVTEIFANMNR
ncbi:MAG: hypothetical protein LQ347_001931 [Umbilicaria vellea]|nr:MAG: hypothetical protein LQ347_001931 [Umbilicaria vellea]